MGTAVLATGVLTGMVMLENGTDSIGVNNVQEYTHRFHNHIPNGARSVRNTADEDPLSVAQSPRRCWMREISPSLSMISSTNSSRLRAAGAGAASRLPARLRYRPVQDLRGSEEENEVSRRRGG